MEINSKEIDHVLVVIPLEKQIDALVAKVFKGRMIDWISDGHQRIILDLANVEFIDSSGLSALIASFKAMDKGGRLVICNIHNTTRSIFDLTKMNRIFPFFNTLEEALKAIA
ncbi:STAS domain-containing protein [Desulfobacter vibrioformis]|uniref:STAS domain-containing protein n=1 Tax=Desulfobacter vibrioformis TaxID=34031 RepID=UPI0005521549|nr:STAS domain-containing protein [Desulfobacter vibrioformis]